ncbi:leucine-rich repeat-containing protein 57-like [Mytilus trossulus]|uniref:leucine-rich repeat-containing protein 57-like n=1 Tax=Mytilus trossulus TaxID=6551 RepID=UPI0030046C20
MEETNKHCESPGSVRIVTGKVENLSANRIGSLPKGLFSSNVNLKELYVSNNNLVSLPDDLLSNNTNLVILELDRNNLGSLPEGLLTFNTNLEYLSLSGNNLVSLPEGLLSDKTNIRELYLSDNKFERTPEGLLTMLTLNTNRLELYLDKNPLMCCLIIELKELASKKTQLEVVGECTISNTTINIRDFKTSDCILPVDGGWSSWFNSSCSVSCGEGIRIQNRTCDNPPPSGSGQNCVGSENKTSVCNLGECPVDGGWSSWFNSSCSVSCGEGVRIRNRTCDNPSPTGSGQNCVGSETETSICNLGKCPSKLIKYNRLK